MLVSISLAAHEVKEQKHFFPISVQKTTTFILAKLFYRRGFLDCVGLDFFCFNLPVVSIDAMVSVSSALEGFK